MEIFSFKQLHLTEATMFFFRCACIDGLVQERRNFIALAMELRLSCTYLSIFESPNSVLTVLADVMVAAGAGTYSQKISRQISWLLKFQIPLFMCFFLSFQGKCQRKDPPCKYLHPPQHLREQLLQNGRNNLILKNLQMQAMAAGLQPMVPGMMPAMVSIKCGREPQNPGMM